VITKKSRKRLQIEASPKVIAQIEELGTLIDSASTAETVRRAISLALTLAKEHKSNNGKLEFIDKDGKASALILFL
jgi:hypothetical protein